jgi:AcrR family transcriptional regulator
LTKKVKHRTNFVMSQVDEISTPTDRDPNPAPLPPGLREINIEARRQRILQGARSLITEGGMAALSMRKLAERAELSVTTLYNLFGSRSEILAALVDDAIDRMNQILEREAPLEDPLERCRAVITVSIRHLVDHQAIFRPMVMASYQGLEAHHLQDRRTAERAADMQRVAIEAAIAQGLLDDTLDPGVLARQIYHGYELAHLQWGFGGYDEESFEARALYGLYLALFGVATDLSRPKIQRELQQLEQRLGSSRSQRLTPRAVHGARKDS